MLDLFIVLAFVVYAVGSGLRSRRDASKNLEEYFLAGRTIPGWKAGVSMAATQYAADTPLLVAGLIATGGLFTLWRLWIYGLAFLLMGLDITALSMAWPSLPEIKRLVRDVRMEDARTAARKALAAPTAKDVTRCLVEGIGDSVDLSVFSGRWSLSLPG